jgi:hypothetical protein
MRRVLAGLLAAAQIVTLHAVPEAIAASRGERTPLEQRSMASIDRASAAARAADPRLHAADAAHGTTMFAQAVPDPGSGAAASDTSRSEPSAPTANSRKKWYWIGAGVVVVGLVVALAAGGGGNGGDPPIDNTLPAPPGRP